MELVTTAEAGPKQFAEGTARAAIQRAAVDAGLAIDAVRLLRLGENAVFEAGNVVIRVGRPGADPEAAKRAAGVSRWLRVEHLPAIEALDVEQSIVVDEMPVTFWRSIGDGENYGSTANLAYLLKQLHALSAPAELDLPPAEPMRRAARRVEYAELEERDREFLTERLAKLRAQYDGLSFELPPGVIHDDASVGNVLVDQEGTPRLIDLDGVSIGPREWDLILTAIYYERYGWHTRDEYETFVEIYGFDIMQWSGYEVLADLRELIMVTWMSQNIGDEKVAAEFAHRMESLRTNGSRRDWQPF